MSHEAILSVIDGMAVKLEQHLRNRGRTDVAMIGIRTGGIWVAEHLHRALDISEPLGVIDISFYRDDFTQIGVNPQVRPSQIAFDVDNRDIVLVDDVQTGGRDHEAAWNGRDASGLYTDPRLIGEVWVGPYLERWPQHAFVLVDEIGIGGYIVGAPDTAEHEQWLEREWLPPLRVRYPIDAFPAGTADAAVVRMLHHPPKRPPWGRWEQPP